MTKQEWWEQCDAMCKKPPLIPGRGKILVSREPTTNVLSRVKGKGGEDIAILGADKFKEPAMRGIVVALGKPKLNGMGGAVPFWVELAQMVTFAQYTGKQYTIDPHEFVVMDEDEVIAAVPKRS